MSDLISKLSEIRSQYNCFDEHERDAYHALSEAIKVLSAQPVITCDGCRFVGTYDTDFPCCSCVRREKDYYEPER